MGLNKASIAQLKAELAAFPPSPTAPRSELKQLVAELFDEILTMKTLGYSFTEIAEAISERSDFEINPGTLRKYWSAERQQRQGQKPQRKRSGKSQRSKKQPLQAQVLEKKQKKSVKADEVDEADQDSPEPAVAINNPVTSDDSSDAWPPENKATSWPPESKSESPVKNHESDSEDDEDDGNGENWEDDDSYTSGLIHEPRFNRIRRS